MKEPGQKKLSIKLATECLSLIFSIGISSIVWAISIYFIHLCLKSSMYGFLLLTPIFATFIYLSIIFFIRVLLPKIRPGRYQIGKDKMAIIWYLHMCLNRSLKSVGLSNLIKSSNILKFFFYRALGAKISYSTNFSIDLEIADPQLTEIEDGVIVGGQSYIGSHMVKGEVLVLSPVVIKKNAFISFRVILGPGTVVGERAVIGPGNSSYNDKIAPGQKIAPFAWNKGSPALQKNF